MVNDYFHSQEFINNIHIGREKNISLALQQDGAIFKANGIISAVNHKIISENIVNQIKKLKDDKTLISGYFISEFAVAALDVLGIESYNGDNEKIVKLIDSKFNF